MCWARPTETMVTSVSVLPTATGADNGGDEKGEGGRGTLSDFIAFLRYVFSAKNATPAQNYTAHQPLQAGSAATCTCIFKCFGIGAEVRQVQRRCSGGRQA